MKQLVVWLTLIISILSDDPPYPCPNANGAYYQAGVFPRFDAATRSLVLVDANGATIRTLDHIEHNLRIINWSPDCRYLTGALGVIGRYESGESRSSGEDYVNWDSRQELVIWDVYSGQRVTSLVRAGGGSFLPSNLVRWSPQSDRALIATAYYGHFLWRADSQAVTELERADLGGWYRGYSMDQLYWDTSRQWLWSTATGNVVTFDMESGLVQAVFSVCPNNTPADCWGETRFGFSPDSANGLGQHHHSRPDHAGSDHCQYRRLRRAAYPVLNHVSRRPLRRQPLSNRRLRCDPCVGHSKFACDV
jgi:hypothetical protein